MSAETMRPVETLWKTRPDEMTDAEFTAVRVACYQRLPDPPRFGLLEFTGMTADEYAEWIMHGTVSERFMRANERRGGR